MSSDNEDDDLEALRTAALATIKQKVKPIENVFKSSDARSATWSEVPASIDYPNYADPIPEPGNHPPSFSFNRSVDSRHFHSNQRRPWRPPLLNAPSSRQNNNFHPRFPSRSFGDRNGPGHDRENRRNKKDYLLPHPHHRHPMDTLLQDAAATHVHPVTHVHPPPAGGSNLIVIQPHAPQSINNDRFAPPSFSHHPQQQSDRHPTRDLAENLPKNKNNVDNNDKHKYNNSTATTTVKEQDSRSKSKLVLPQDKYHTPVSSSLPSTTTTKPEPVDSPESKSKDKFSRYDKSDSEEDDEDNHSEADDIAKEIDAVLQDDFLCQDEPTQDSKGDKEEKSAGKANKKTPAETGKDLTPLLTETEEVLDYDEDVEEEQQVDQEKEEDQKEEEPSTSTTLEKSPVKNEEKSVAESSLSKELEDISDTESLDLDRLVHGGPVLGDLEDLDSLVEKEPGDVCLDVSNVSESKNSGDTDISGDNNNEDLANLIHSSPMRRDNSSPPRRRSLSPRRRSLSPRPRRPLSPSRRPISPSRYPVTSPSRYPLSPSRRHISPSRPPISPSRRPFSPSRPGDSYSRRHLSPRRSRSPFQRSAPMRRSTSPNLNPPRRSRSRSPYRRRSPHPRRSMSPRRRGMPSHFERRQDGYFPRRQPFGQGRRRSLSPHRRGPSPSSRDRYRDYRPLDGRSRVDEKREENRGPREQQREGEKSENKSNIVNDPMLRGRKGDSVKNLDRRQRETVARSAHTGKGPSPQNDNKSQPEKEVEIDLEKLSPEERAKIEARSKKFGSKEEVNVESTKTVSLKDIKKRDKKVKKSEKLELNETANVQTEAPPDAAPAKKTAPSGISLKKLRKKQEQKKKQEEVEEAESPKALRLADLDDESEDNSDDDRSWRKGGSKATGIGITFSQKVSTKHSKAPLVSLGRVVQNKRGQGDRDNRHRDRDRYRQRERRAQPHSSRQQVLQNSNSWSSDEDEDHGAVNRLSSSIYTSRRDLKSKSVDKVLIPPEQLRIQVQLSPSKESKRKSKSKKTLTSESSVLHVPTKRSRQVEEKERFVEEEEEVVEPVIKKVKKKKEKKKRHKESPESVLEREVHESPNVSDSPPKTSVLDRLGKKLSLEKLEKKEKKKKSKRNRSEEGSKSKDLDVHIQKMKARNEEILRRQREIELDKERYG